MAVGTNGKMFYLCKMHRIISQAEADIDTLLSAEARSHRTERFRFKELVVLPFHLECGCRAARMRVDSELSMRYNVAGWKTRFVFEKKSPGRCVGYAFLAPNAKVAITWRLRSLADKDFLAIAKKKYPTEL